MKIEEALIYINNAIDYWVQESEYENKKEDVKKTDEAWSLIQEKINSKK